jgi:hypothetical protein
LFSTDALIDMLARTELSKQDLVAREGAPARAIQELAGHQDLDTTQRYMHLSPAAHAAAIRLLDGPPEGGHYVLAQGIPADRWLAMSEPRGSPKADAG